MITVGCSDLLRRLCIALEAPEQASQWSLEVLKVMFMNRGVMTVGYASAPTCGAKRAADEARWIPEGGHRWKRALTYPSSDL